MKCWSTRTTPTNNSMRLLCLFGGSLVVCSFVLLCSISSSSSFIMLAEAADDDFSSSFGAYLSQAKSLLDTGMAFQQLSQLQQQPTPPPAVPPAQQAPSLMPNEDPRVTRMLSDSIKMATDLINNYRENGLSNMPSFPNLPGLNVIMRLPDKLLRAELSMLQDEIRMAQQMMQNPITATMNAPRDLASMFGRMAEQLEQ